MLQCISSVLGVLPQVFIRTPHERRSAPSEAELEGQLRRRLYLRKPCDAGTGRSCLRLLRTQVCRTPSFPGLVLLLVCGTGGGVAFGSAANPPTNSELFKRYFDAQDGSRRDVGGGRDGGQEDNDVAGELARLTDGISAQQSPFPLWQHQQQQQHQPQQPKNPGEGQSPQSQPSWTNMFRFFNQQEGSEQLPNLIRPPALATAPLSRPKVAGTPPIATGEAGLRARVPQPHPRAEGAPPISGAGAGKPLRSDTVPVPPLEFLKTGLSWLPPERQLTREEEEEEAIADAIIHGVGKKRVPRIRTGVDALVEALEDQKLQQIAKTPRQLDVLRMRRQADAKARQATTAVPEYFTRMAKEAAAYHRQQQAEQEAWKKAQPSTALGERLQKLARRRRQKDKLLLWRENQIYQLPEDSPDVDERIAEALRADKELELKLHEELPTEDLLWAVNDEDAEKEEESQSRKEKVKGDEQEEAEQETK